MVLPTTLEGRIRMSSLTPGNNAYATTYASAFFWPSSLNPNNPPEVSSSVNWVRQNASAPATLGSVKEGSKILQKGFQCVSPGEKSSEAATALSLTIMNVQRFFFEWRRELPAVNVDSYFVGYPEKNAYFSPPSQTPAHFCFQNEYTKAPEVVCHEYTHALVHAGKPLQGRFGNALDEALADICGLVFVHANHLRALSSEDHWKIGIDPQHSQHCIRDLSKPGDFQTNLFSDDEHLQSLLLSHPFLFSCKRLSSSGKIF